MHSCLPPAQTYPRLGRVVGRFYDEAGRPTAALTEVHTKAEDGKELKVCLWLHYSLSMVSQTLIALTAGHAAPAATTAAVPLCAIISERLSS